MDETTYGDAGALAQYGAEGRAYPGAVYDLTFGGRFLVYHTDMLGRLVYYAVDRRTGRSSEVLRRGPGDPVGRAEYESVLAPALTRAVRYTGDQRARPSGAPDPLPRIDWIFRVLLPRYGFAVREEQIRLSKAMCRGFLGKSVSVCEAEVGTGKTMAYLVAALVARDSGRAPAAPITIATSSIELQRAIAEREIPRLSRMLVEGEVLPRPLTVVLRKGREHYLCRRRLRAFTDWLGRNPERYGRLLGILGDGGFADRAFDLDAVRLPEAVKAAVCARGCAGCRLTDGCAYRRLIEIGRLGRFDFQVVNHHLFLTSARMRLEERNPLLADSALVVVDEAHRLRDAARETLGDRLGQDEIARYASAARRLNVDPARLPLYRSVLDGLTADAGRLFERARRKAGTDDTDAGVGTIAPDAGDLALIDGLIARVGRVERMRGTEPRSLALRAAALTRKLASLRRRSDRDVWVRDDGDDRISLCSAPRDVGRVLHRYVWSSGASFVLTSGTMSDGSGFSFFERENGLDLVPRNLRKAGAFASPFDFAGHTRLYLPEGLPPPEDNSPAYIQAVSDEIVRIVRATNGRAAVLFTSYRLLGAVYARTKDRLAPYDVVRMTRANRNAVSDFRNSRNAVLFASGPMWEGVDCAGDCLSAVIIPRLPFPIRSAVMEGRKGRYGSVGAFVDACCVPEMLIKLRQGVGRLIRRETDTGLVSILDSRAVSGRYAERVGRALAGFPRARSLEEVEAFFHRVKDPSYYEK